MINLKSYVVMKEELDADNIQWKFNNWSKGVESSVLDAFMLDASYQKDIDGFKKLVDDSGINFNALTDMMNDDAKGLPDNYDNIYVLKKIIDTIKERMISISEYLNENLDEFVFELKSQTYLNAAKKAKKLGDPRAEKFLQAFKDNIDKELMAAEGPDDEEKKFNIYYNADKKSIIRLKSLDKRENGNGPLLEQTNRGTYFDIQNDDIEFIANVYVASNKDGDRQIFLRQSIITQDKWKYVSKEFNRVAEKINDSESKKPFTFVKMFTNTGTVEFFYIIDTDKLIPIFLNHGKGNKYEDDECLDNYSENDKTAINAICKAMNQNHKDL